MYTFTYQKALRHALLLFVFKIVENLQCILKAKIKVSNGQNVFKLRQSMGNT